MRIASRILILSFCFLIGLYSKGQTDLIDSLQRALQTSLPDTAKISAYLDLSRAYRNKDSLQSIAYAKRAVEFAETTKNKDWYLKAVFGLSRMYDRYGMYGDARSLLYKTIAAQKDSSLIAKVYVELARHADIAGSLSESLLFYDTALTIFEKLGDHGQQAYLLAHIGRHYYALGNYGKASELYFRSQKIYDANGIKDRNYGHLLHYIGSVFKRQGFYEKALEYYEQEYALADTLDDKLLKAEALYLCAAMYGNLGEKEKELDYSMQALTIYQQLGRDRSIALMYGNLSHWYEDQGDLRTAESYLEQAFEMYLKLNEKDKLAWVYADLGRMYSIRGQHRKGIDYITKGIEVAKQTQRKQLLRLKENSRELAFAYQRAGDHKKAFETYLQYEFYKDSLESQASSQIMHDLEAKYENEKKQQELEYKDNALKKLDEAAKEMGYLNKIALFAFLLALAMALFVSRLQAQRKKANRALEKQNNRLERLSLVASRTDNAVIILDPEGNLEWVNRAFMRITGFDKDKIKKSLRKPMSDLSHFDDFETTFEQCKKEKKTQQFESSLVTPEGDSRWVSSTITPILDKEGVITKYVIIESDITEQKRAEQVIQQKNEEITDSINYARKIQDAILTSDDFWTRVFKEYFVLYKPRDIVSGDFYWAYESVSGKKIWAVADCTGHGVPGAFMSMVGNALLNEIVIENQIEEPEEILNHLRWLLIKTLKQDKAGHESSDGMDMAICALDNGTIKFAGANNPLYLIRDNQLHIYNGDKQPIGKYLAEVIPFTQQKFEVQDGDLLYLFSDGYIDQFGGQRNKKFLKRRFKELLIKNSSQPLAKQKEVLDKTIDDWRGKHEQVDDICVIGVKL